MKAVVNVEENVLFPSEMWWRRSIINATERLKSHLSYVKPNGSLPRFTFCGLACISAAITENSFDKKN